MSYPRQGWWVGRFQPEANGELHPLKGKNYEYPRCLFCGSTDLVEDYGPQRCRKCGFHNEYSSELNGWDREKSETMSKLSVLFETDGQHGESKV